MHENDNNDNNDNSCMLIIFIVTDKSTLNGSNKHIERLVAKTIFRAADT